MSEKNEAKGEIQATTPKKTSEMIRYTRKKFAEYQMTGKVVIRDSDREWEVSPQSPKVKFHLYPPAFTDHALRDWQVFTQDLQQHTGKHKHSGGGVAIFVLEGKGYTIVDGERYDWQEGDLILLPGRVGGVEHQHFNLEPGKSCKWCAFIYLPNWDLLASQTTQIVPAGDQHPNG